MNFGVGLATGMEGLMYPIPFGNIGTLVRISQAAERLGYHHVGGNDHLTTQHYVAAEWSKPPNYYRPSNNRLYQLMNPAREK